jgi:hypothetical protein
MPQIKTEQRKWVFKTDGFLGDLVPTSITGHNRGNVSKQEKALLKHIDFFENPTLYVESVPLASLQSCPCFSKSISRLSNLEV